MTKNFILHQCTSYDPQIPSGHHFVILLAYTYSAILFPFVNFSANKLYLVFSLICTYNLVWYVILLLPS